MKKNLFILFSILIPVIIQAQIIHVPGDRQTIQAGINAASDGDTVLVADGNYMENINFNGKAITVASNFLMDGDTNHINNTIINGSQPANPTYGSAVTFITGEDTNSVICGFTITGGTGMTDPVYGARMGGGILCYYASAKIIHNKIIGNAVTSSSEAFGGGVACYRETGKYWTVITNNNIFSNLCSAGATAGGGICIIGDALIQDNCIVGNDCNSSSDYADGGGIYHLSFNTPPDLLILNGNQISNNTLTTPATARGAGVSTWYSNSIISHNEMTFNSMTGNSTNGCGLFFRETVYAEIKDNLFSHNSVNTSNIYWGVGCFSVMPAGPVNIDNNEFSYNEGQIGMNAGAGGGLAFMDAGMNELTISRNMFRENAADNGGGFYARSSYNQHFTNNVLSGNHASYGGGAMLYIPASGENSRPAFINNTIAGNSSTMKGGAVNLNCETNIPVIFNCIFYDNSSPVGNDISYIGSPDSLVISYSDIDADNISGLWRGAGNIFEDPLFEGSGMHPYSLSPGSPCIDKGTPDTTGLYLPLGDIMNHYRIWDGDLDGDTIVDMGAYEFGADSIIDVIPRNTFQAQALNIHCYPNPFQTTITIEFELEHPESFDIFFLNQIGQRIQRVFYDGRKGRNEVNWNAGSLPPGIYFCRVTSGKMVATCKLVKW